MTQAVPLASHNSMASDIPTELSVKNTVGGFLAVLGGASLTFALLRFGGVNPEPAAGICAGFLPGVHPASRALQQRELRRNPALSLRLPDPQNFYLPTWRLILFGTFVLVGITQFSGFIGGLAAALLGLSAEPATAAGAVVSWVSGLVTAATVGAWIGSRARRLGRVVAAVAVVLCVLLNASLNLTLASMSESARSAMELLVGSEAGLGMLLSGLGLTALLWTASAALGVWRGQRRRPSIYLVYLLSLISADARETISEMAYEEASAGLAKS